MNIITSKAVHNIGLFAVAFAIALVAVVSMPASAHAQWEGDGPGDSGISSGGDWGGDSGIYTGGDWTGSGPGDSGACFYGCGESVYTGGDWTGYGPGDSGTCTYGCSSDYALDNSYGGTPSSGFSMPSFGSPSSGCSSCGGSSMPSFSSGYSSIPFSSPANQGYRQTIIPTLPSYAQAQASVCSAVNSCNSTSSYTDNSVYAPDNSYTDNSVYSAPTTVTVTAPTTVTTDSHNQQIAYAQPERNDRDRDYDYDYPTYRQPTYQQPVYQQPSYPVAYNTTPYITLSQAPYTGLDLGPMGEVLYWTFLVLWCLGAAYLIVVKRVQNKLVSALNGFLFGNTVKTVAHTAHAPQAHAVASAPLVEEGIDSFIQSQIKRA